MFPQIATIACIFVTALMAPALDAQEVRDIEPAWRVVERDATPGRSGPDSVYYTVLEFAAGSVVRVDGETDSFARVRYPAGSTVMVPVDEVRVIGQEADGSTRIELIEPSGLRAPSELMGMSGSWMAVYEPALEAGTVLRVRDALKNEAGDVVGYSVFPVEPPASAGFARMFVGGDALRTATPEEIDRHLARVGRGVGEPPDAAPGAEAAIEQADGVAGVTDDASVEQPSESNSGTRTGSDAEPASEPEPNAMDSSTPAADEIDGVSAESSQGGADVRTPRQGQRAPLPAGLEELEASFESARKQPASEVDQALDELLAEFRRTRDVTDDDDRLAWQLDQRIEWLEMRIQTRDQRRAIRAALAEADERAVALEAEVDAWRRGRSYQLVGRLTASSVYNGERLPRMYRVQAVNSIDGTPRTLGYLEPGQGVDSKVGSVVGIVGEARFDPQLRLMVIRPVRLDVMPE
ncbi:MAG: hypothetical protein AAGA55_08290 [Planctomycetota bacterium]